MVPAISTTPANEVWRPIGGWEGLYKVSNKGQVRSLDYWYMHTGRWYVKRLVFHKGRIMKQQENKGYLIVKLNKEGKCITRQVHRLVAETFIPNPNNLPVVNHKDENPKNNNVSNLEWCTQGYNVHYGGGLDRLVKSNEYRMRTIEQLTKSGEHVAYHKGISQLIKRTGFCERSIYRCLKKKPRFKSAYGYKWRYVEQ